MERRDVLAVVTSVVDRDIPPPALPFELETDLWLEGSDDDLLERLKFACEPAEWPPRSPGDRVVDVTHCPYMFVRRHSDDDERLEWDPDQRIFRAVAISRLVHSNSVWPHYAAKVLTDGDDMRIEPKIVRRQNYAEDPDARPWLSQGEAEALRLLLERDRTIHIPEHGRLWHARWFLEYASQTHYVEVRLLHVIAGLEALMNTDSRRATKIFVKRLPRLSKIVGLPISGTKADKTYQDRSRVVHGSPVVLGTASRKEQSQARLVAAEAVLRAAVRLAHEDDEFLRALDDDASVEALLGKVA